MQGQTNILTTADSGDFHGPQLPVECTSRQRQALGAGLDGLMRASLFVSADFRVAVPGTHVGEAELHYTVHAALEAGGDLDTLAIAWDLDLPARIQGCGCGYRTRRPCGPAAHSSGQTVIYSRVSSLRSYTRDVNTSSLSAKSLCR